MAPAKKISSLELADPESKAFRMEAWPFYWLARVSRGYAFDMDVVLKRVGMDVARWRVLMILAEKHPASVSELAYHAVLKLSTMTKTVQRLEGDGLVVTASKATDARVTEVSLTRTGEEAVARVRNQAGRVFRQAFDGFDAKEIADLNSVLRRILDNLETIPS
jgi:MarR family transcriptional regulator, organic hydroperoxide resistance regulator